MKNPKYFLLITFLISLAFEYLLTLSFVPEWMYRLLYVRYLFAGALGTWLAVRDKISIKWLIVGAIISFIYIFAVNYLHFQAGVIYPAWLSHHAPSYFWTSVILIAGLTYLPERPTNFIHSTIAKLGQASWHIFLVQIAFFWTAARSVRALVFSGFTLPNNLDIATFLQMSTGGLILTCLNLGICLSLGYIFFQIESKLMTRYHISKISQPQNIH